MRYIIVDDEELARVHLEKLGQKIPALDHVKSFDNGIDAMQFLKNEKVDLVFLDIEMPDLNGIDLLRNSNNLPLVIFTTGKKDYAAELFEYRDIVVDYLTKPIKLTRLIKAVDQAEEMSTSQSNANNERDGKDDYIFIKTNKRLVRIDLKKLLYVETVGDYVLFRTSDDKYLVHSTLKNIDSRLSHPDFLKVHRSFIVNLTKVQDIEDNSLVIDDKVIPISRAHKPVLMKRITPI